jgi:integrase
VASIDTLKDEAGKIIGYKVRWRYGKGRKAPAGAATFDKYQDARDHKIKIEGEVKSISVGSIRRLTAFEYLDNWIKDKGKDRKNPVKPKTVEGYTRNIAIFKRGLTGHLGETAATKLLLAQLSKSQIDKAYDWLLEQGSERVKGEPLTKQTVYHVHRMLHKALKDALGAELISRNPAALADAPKVQGKNHKYKRQVRDYTPDEVSRQLDIAATDKGRAPDTYAMVAAVAVTGLRRGELAGIALDALDLDEPNAAGNFEVSIFRTVVEVDDSKVTVDANDTATICAVHGDIVVMQTPKTEGSIRKLQIPPALAGVLRAQRTRVLEAALATGKDYHRKPMFLFPGPMGLPMHPKLITRRFGRLKAAAGIEDTKVSPVHSWRHTVGTVLWHATKNDKLVQEQLGHSRIGTTKDFYVHATPEGRDLAAEIMGKLIRQNR